MINIKNFDPNQIKLKSYKNSLLHWVYYYQKSQLCKYNSVNPLYLIINKVDGYIEERIGNKYLTVVFNDKNQDTLKKYTELWDKIKELISLVTNTSGDYDGK